MVQHHIFTLVDYLDVDVSTSWKHALVVQRWSWQNVKRMFTVCDLEKEMDLGQQ